MEPEDFIGCILSIRTQPSAADGASKAIIGTVRLIDQQKQTITLDEVMINGTIVDDGYVLNSGIIQDLSVCPKVEYPYQFEDTDLDLLPQPQQPEPATSTKTPLKTSNQITHEPSLTDSTTYISHIREPSNAKSKPIAIGVSKKVDNVSVPVQPHREGKPSAFVKTDKGKVDKMKNNPFFAINPVLGGAMGKGPLPLQPSSTEVAKMQSPLILKPTDPRVVYTASDLEKKYFDQESKSPTKSKVLESIMAQFSGSQTTPTSDKNLSSASLIQVNNLAIQDQNVDPAKKVFNISTDSPLYKLIAPQQTESQVRASKNQNQLSRPTSGTITKEHVSSQSKSFAIQSLFDKNIESDRIRTGKNDRSGKHNQSHAVPNLAQPTFEMTNDEIRAQEFDFEENLAMFEKLPVSVTPKPVKQAMNRAPEFGKTDTTYYAERHVSSVQLKEKPTKVFLTDTGVVVPAVSLSTRSQILNLAHNFGFTHERMVEIMGRAVAQTVIPMLGDSYRLSPEREDDRPTVLVFAGPQWNGAVALCSARILATQGIRTIVYIWNFELPLFTTELQLYRLTKQRVVNDVKDLKGIHIDLVIGGAHDHRDTTFHNSLFQKCSKGKPVVLVDPPLQSSYRKHFLDLVRTERGTSGHAQLTETRLAIVTPTLPLAYPSEPSVKIYLVNLGIPQGIFEQNEVLYKSPFGDKLILQLFASKQASSAGSGNK